MIVNTVARQKNPTAPGTLTLRGFHPSQTWQQTVAEVLT